MTRVLSRRRFLLLAAAAAWAAPGCGDSLATVTGQVVDNGQPVALADGESVQIDFATADDAYPPLSVIVFAKKDGSFAADMNDGTGAGLTPGKYRVRVNSESTSLRRKIDRRVFKASAVIDAGTGASVRLVIDIGKASITQ